MKKNILDLSLSELEDEIIISGEKKFRAKQIFSSLHSKNLTDFNLFPGIPKELKHKLSDNFLIPRLKNIHVTDSQKFSTKKFLFELEDGKKKHLIEAVLISENERNTICVSTQVGCNVGCEFCATGKMGFSKNLSVSQIISQIYEIKKITGVNITNIVYMGMGEPFLNYNNMLKSLSLLCDPSGMNLSSRRITVSTVGFKGKIAKFADDLSKEENKSMRNVKLALSLHSTDNGIRESIIPTSAKNTLPEIYKELGYFYQKTGNKITYEYIFFEGSMILTMILTVLKEYRRWFRQTLT